MDNARIWEFEESLWVGEAEHYRDLIDPECLMVLPAHPFVFTGEEAIAAVQDTPRWDAVAFSHQSVARPQEGLIVINYKADAQRGDQAYTAYCTSTLRRLAHDEWRVVQHQQTVPLTQG
ncbi:DUF4440 domain-containing protein [Erythrobacter sp. WG]|uniref:DUF4440 domain-containing protein n=1 Tax=Erythrobacter sp. WG TaxID=2985510 RepID=UPI002270784A|nr:DUF4440 domain-containing protein [Erythrobacter sp. WG]MCX9146036.1 DUF4440 domain-containing protein [Erythrobacter sp. WG]